MIDAQGSNIEAVDRDDPRPDPIRTLLRGEELVAAGRTLEGLHTLRRCLDESNALWTTNDETENLFDLIVTSASAEYTLAEIARVQAAHKAKQPTCKSYADWCHIAHSGYAKLEAYSSDRSLTLLEPDAPVHDDILIKNALVYLIARSEGMLTLQYAISINDVETRSRTLVRARERLYTADDALANGIMREQPLAAVPLPTNPEDPEQIDAYTFGLMKRKLDTRKRRRAFDADLALGLTAATALLDRRGSYHPFPGRSPTIALPSFKKYGPMASSVLAIS